MRPVLTFLLLACACAAQDSKPPADVDAALRERVDQFFRYHVSAQFRKAEALTAEDSKDFFYNAPKPHYLSYGGIQTIRYSDNFTHAYVTVTVQSASSAEFGNLPALPIPSMWKVEDGKWCWYIDKDVLRHSMFGDISQSTVDAALAAMADPDKPRAVPADMAAALKTSVPDFGAAMTQDPNIPHGQVKFDPKSVDLKPGESATLNVKNTGSDKLDLLLMGQVQGVEMAIDRKELTGGQSAVVTLKAGANAKSGNLNVVVIQTGEVLPFAVTVK
ncbi:MAG TPA: hypothetical protein VN736_25260 [Candidatus Limnocylindrales bacterium]|nr:hypothetical protein [Candidatus Limnocylindrales bacterium]